MGASGSDGGVVVSSKELKLYCSWDISTNRYMGEEVKSGLVKILEESGMKKKFLSKTKFKCQNAEVKFEFDKRAPTTIRTKVEVYARNIQEGERMRQIIQQEIDADNKKHYIISLRYDFLLNSRQ